MLNIQNIDSLFGVSKIVFSGDQDEYFATISYSNTADFFYRTPGLTGVITQTVTWVLKSSQPIVGGTFLDNTPWIVDNGDINLYSVDPQSTQLEAIYYPSGDVLGPTATYMFDANNTVINPDFGKELVGGTVGFFTFQTADTNNVPASSVVSGMPGNIFHLFPFDGRAGHEVRLLTTERIGVHYDSRQKWNNIPTKLKKGDMVVTGVSHYDDYRLVPNTLHGCRFITSLTFRTGFMDMFACFTLIGATYAQIANNSFRPPINWDPIDRENAPIFQELDNFNDYLFEYPNYNFSSNTKTWTKTPTQIFLNDYDLADGITFTPKKENLGSAYVKNCSDQFQFQGSRFSRDFDPSEYGGDSAKRDEIRFITCLDASLNENLRNKIRRSIVQRGIDAYGSCRSTGRRLNCCGGHGSYEYNLLPIAYLSTRSSDMYELMKDEHQGNTANSTYKGKDRVYLSDGPYHKYNTFKEQIKKFPKEMTSENFWHPGRWQNLEIAGITWGTDPVHGPFEKVFVRPPKNTIIGNILTEIDTGLTSQYTWKPEDLYNYSQPMNTSPGRWNIGNNVTSSVRKQFVGGYIQNKSRGTTFISKIIFSSVSDQFPNEVFNEGFYPTNSLQIIYTRDNIFTGGETYCNISPAVQEDLSEDLWFSSTTGRTIAYPNAVDPYAWSPLVNAVGIGIVYRALEQSNTPIPPHIKDRFDFFYQSFSTKFGLIGTFHKSNASYDRLNDACQLALVRKYILNGQLGPTMEESYNNLKNTRKRVYFPENNTNWTWIENDPPPANITVVSRGMIRTLFDNFNYFTENSTTPVGLLRKRFIEHPENKNNILLFLESRTGTSSTGVPLGINYTTYVNDKNFYIWINGAQKPIKMIKYAETLPTTNQVVWSQTWAFPGGATFNYLFEKFPHVNSHTVHGNVLTQKTLFFADP